MSRTVPAPSAFPRRDGDPVVDLSGYQAEHAALLADLAEVAAAVRQVPRSAGSARVPVPSALATYVRQLATVTRDHLDWEDRDVWPVLASSAGPAVDLSDLTDDHAVLRPLLTRAGSADGAAGLHATLTELRALLAEHLADEERAVLPAIRQYVSVGDYRRVARAVRTTGTPAHRLWLLGWRDHHRLATRPAARAVLPAARASFRRGRRRALGAAG